jgi:hypothetical protein
MRMDQIACSISFNSFSTLSYNSSCFTPYLYKRSSYASSMASWTKMMSSSMSVASSCGLLALVLFLVEGFCGETFLFCSVTVSVRGSFDSVASPSSFFSPSSPPPFPFTLSPPPRESDPFPSKSLSSSLVSIFWTSSFFFFFFALDYPTCLTWVTRGILMMSVPKSYASLIGTRNFFGHYFMI